MPARLTDAIREFTRTIAASYDRDELLQRLTSDATSALNATGAGIMLDDGDGRLAYAAASDETIMEAERHQDRLAEGACHDAYTHDTAVVVSDLAATDRWPNYGPRVLGLGLVAVIGVPMVAGGTPIGVLNVYRDSVTEWTRDDVDACEMLAAMGAAYILHADQQRASSTLTDQLQHALDARVLIEQAKGMVMSRDQVTALQALDTLRDAARRSSRKLIDIARETLADAATDPRGADDHAPRGVVAVQPVTGS